MIWFHDYFFNLQDLPWPLLTRNGFGKPEIPIVLITVEGNLKINYLVILFIINENFYFLKTISIGSWLDFHNSPPITVELPLVPLSLWMPSAQRKSNWGMYLLKYINKFLLSWNNISDLIDFTHFYYLFLVWKHQDMPTLMEFLKIVFLVSMDLIGVKWVYFKEFFLSQNFFVTEFF